MNFIIEDWAGNRLFSDKEFKTLNDAWACVLEHVENEEDLDDYSIKELEDEQSQ